jgi:hypothetical protein
MKRIALLLALLVVAGPAVVAQDEGDGGAAPKPEDVVALLQKGIELYKAGKVDEAVKVVQKAHAAMQQEAAKSLERFARPAPEGYTCETKTNSGSTNVTGVAYSWADVNSTYTREKDGARFEVKITNMPQVQAGFRAQVQMLNNPQMLAAMNSDPGRKVTKVERGGFIGLFTEEAERWSGFVVGDALLVSFEGDKQSKEAAHKVLDGTDWAGLGEADKRIASAK